VGSGGGGLGERVAVRILGLGLQASLLAIVIACNYTCRHEAHPS
jgi:hypothetical protein